MDEKTAKSKCNFATAFLALQRELPVVPKSREGYNFKYAPYEEIVRVAFPVMLKHGFTISHASTFSDGFAQVRTTLTYAATGETVSSSYVYDHTAKDQEVGKCLTYGKRYNTALLLGIAIEGEPDVDDAVPQKNANSTESNDF